MRWIRFKELNEKKRMHRLASSNFSHNISIGIKKANDSDIANTNHLSKDWNNSQKYSSAVTIEGKRLLRCQYSGNFSKMKLSLSKMSNTCCEILATYNALVLSSKISDNENYEAFFKLASEFVANALYVTSTGIFGSNPKKIPCCLDAYNQDYTLYKSIEELDNDMRDGDIAIISYRHHLVCIHTYCCIKKNGKFISINRGSGCLYEWENKTMSECLKNKRLIIGLVMKNNKQ